MDPNPTDLTPLQLAEQNRRLQEMLAELLRKNELLRQQLAGPQSKNPN
jgi:hypothetical protein